MSKTPFLDHRAVQRVMDESPALNSLIADQEAFDHLWPITMEKLKAGELNQIGVGFHTADGRLAMIVPFDEFAQENFGKPAIDEHELLAMGLRATHWGLIENAAIAAQARAVKLFTACAAMHETIITGSKFPKKEAIRIATLLHEIRQEDEANAEAISEMLAGTKEARLSNKWVLRMLGMISRTSPERGAA